MRQFLYFFGRKPRKPESRAGEASSDSRGQGDVKNSRSNVKNARSPGQGVSAGEEEVGDVGCDASPERDYWDYDLQARNPTLGSDTEETGSPRQSRHERDADSPRNRRNSGGKDDDEADPEKRPVYGKDFDMGGGSELSASEERPARNRTHILTPNL